jgi:hypothetical protein
MPTLISWRRKKASALQRRMSQAVDEVEAAADAAALDRADHRESAPRRGR